MHSKQTNTGKRWGLEMIEKHTPGRLRYDYEPGFCGELLHDNGTTMCAFVDEPNEANARRLVACWNACQNLDTDLLETFPLGMVSAELERALRHMADQRDELLAALKEVVRVIESNPPSITDTVWVTGSSPETLYDHCRAAIAKAEGSAA